MLRREVVFALLLAASLASSAYVFNTNFYVNPTLTDSNIDRKLAGPGYGDHRVSYNETLLSTSDKFGLWVHLAGSGGQPKHTTYTSNTAAGQGYHAISLGYQNPTAIGIICGSATGISGKEQCQVLTRREAILGQDLSTYINVTYANSVVNRLEKLLRYLDANYPTIGWNRYYTASKTGAEAINWQYITFAGHSQGSSTSQIVAGLFPIQRVCQLSEAVYLTPTGPYLAGQLATTPSERYFSFMNSNDSLYNDVQNANNNTLQLLQFGPIVNQDNSTPPYGGSHILVTSMIYDNPHGSVSTDTELNFTADGTPVYDTVWRYIFGVPTNLKSQYVASPVSGDTPSSTGVSPSTVTSEQSPSNFELVSPSLTVNSPVAVTSEPVTSTSSTTNSPSVSSDAPPPGPSDSTPSITNTIPPSIANNPSAASQTPTTDRVGSSGQTITFSAALFFSGTLFALPTSRCF